MTGAISAPSKSEDCQPHTSYHGNDRDHDLSYPSPGFFEGAEKLMEIHFRRPEAPTPTSPLTIDGAIINNTSSATGNEDTDIDTDTDSGRGTDTESESGRGGLRNVSRTEWEKLLRLVNCEIVSTLCNDAMDSYVLSESSMFVYPHKFILKTCGTTTLLHAVAPFLEIARKQGLTSVENVFYSRKCFIQPDRQLSPHINFKAEVAELKAIFDGGESYVLGPMNGDHWYLFTAGEINTPPGSCPRPLDVAPDHTLEILMHDLDRKAMRPFYRNEAFVSTRVSSRVSGIMDLIPEASVDDLVFDPCGYSANGIIDDSYFTIHVTPQPECSFASFETNLPLENYTKLVNKVIRVFCPSRFTVTLFMSEAAICGMSNEGIDVKKIAGYQRTNYTVTHFTTHNLTFLHFVRV